MRFMVLGLLLACQGDVAETGQPGEPLEAVALPASIPTEGLSLEGELLLPDRWEGEPVMGVVLAHGSGPNGRDGTASGQLNMGFGFELDVLRELAVGLQQRGFAVLRYDKRSCFSGNGCPNSYPVPSDDVGMPEFMADVSAALDWMDVRTDIGELAVVGHSQGGTYVPLLAEERGDLASGVILAGAHDDIDVLLRYQHDFSADLLRALGYGEAEIAAQLEDLDALVTDVEALSDGTFSGASIGGVPTSFWQEWLDMGEAARQAGAQSVTPLAAVSGDYDWNVPVNQTEQWHALGLGGEVVPCVTHALNCVSEPDWQSIGVDDIGTEVAPELVDAVAAALSP